MAAFAVAAVGGLALAAAAGWWLILVGAACIAAGWLYTGGPRPYGYAGLGRGVRLRVLRAGGHRGYRLRPDRPDHRAWPSAAAVPVGLLAVALLVVNNLRDIPGDTAQRQTHSGGADRGRRPRGRLYAVVVLVPFGWPRCWRCARPGALLALAGPAAGGPAGPAGAGGTEGKGLIAVLGATGRLQLVFGALLAVGIAL